MQHEDLKDKIQEQSLFPVTDEFSNFRNVLNLKNESAEVARAEAQSAKYIVKVCFLLMREGYLYIDQSYDVDICVYFIYRCIYEY